MHPTRHVKNHRFPRQSPGHFTTTDSAEQQSKARILHALPAKNKHHRPTHSKGTYRHIASKLLQADEAFGLIAQLVVRNKKHLAAKNAKDAKKRIIIILCNNPFAFFAFFAARNSSLVALLRQGDIHAEDHSVTSVVKKQSFQA